MEKIFDMTVLSDLRLKVQFCWSINEDWPKTYYIFLNLTEKHIGVEDAISIQKERNDEQWFGFLDEDSQHIMQNQSDTLVITMLVARISMRRTLGDSRSSIIVMYSKTSKRMGIQAKKIYSLILGGYKASQERPLMCPHCRRLYRYPKLFFNP